MSLSDARGVPLSGATPTALVSYEHALAAFLSWRSGVEAPLTQALDEAPGFVMAHLLKAYLLVGSRDPRRVRAAAPLAAAAAALAANDHERLHLAALTRVLADDYEGAAAALGVALRVQPRDVLALTVASGIDYLMGDAARMRDRVESVLSAWPSDLPAYHSVQAMHAFALVESGDYGRAEDAARTALALDESDARAHHAMAHVFEMTERNDAGVRWMSEHARHWSEQTAVATHGWWHLALFHLAQGDGEAALALYDRRLRAGGSTDVADLIDASALLWRLSLHGVATGTRWADLAAAWAPHSEHLYCSFSDVHAMLAFVGAHDWGRAQQLEQALVRSQALPTRHGASTRELGLPACRGLMAFGRGDHALAIALLASLPARVHRLGGSHAQRDVLHLTLLRAVEAIRRPVRPRATQETRRTAAQHAAAMPTA
jgi:tetratricopeptide (TPR) repeat protein